MKKSNIEHIIQILQRKTGYLFNKVEEDICNKKCDKYTKCTKNNKESCPKNIQFHEHFYLEKEETKHNTCEFISCKNDKTAECPYLFLKPLDGDEKRRNPYRFVQCYVNSPDFVNFLKSNNYITSAALFRIHKIEDNKTTFLDNFWYPFYTGNAYIQLPTFAPKDEINDEIKDKDKGDGKFPEELRWLVTTQRNESKINSGDDSISFNLFKKIQTTNYPKDQKNRYIDVCDGYASFFMLYFIISKRFESLSKEKKTISEFDKETDWIYADSDVEFLNWISSYYSQKASISILKLKLLGDISIRETKWIRNSTWKEDLQLLGLLDKDCNPTDRFEYFKKWLNKDLAESDVQIQAFKEQLSDIIDLNVQNTNCNILPITIKEKTALDSLNYNKAKKHFTLLPPLHIIVRAFQTTPIRWIFIPFGVTWQQQEGKFLNTSGMILLLKDNLNSKAYKPKIDEKYNIIHKNVNELLPVLTSLFTIEEQSLQDYLHLERIKLDKQKTEAQTRAAISQLYARTDAHDLGHVLDALKSIEDIFSDETEMEFKQYNFCSHKNYNTLLTNNEKSGLLDTFGLSNFHDKECKDPCKCSCSKKSQKFHPKLIGYFIKFLKERMDFRADVATTDPNSLNTLDFYRDVFLPFSNNLIFNNRISGISDSNLKYSFEIKGFEIINGKKETVNNAKVAMPVAIPNDVLGCHAMYILWSNIIRNTVKHGDLPDDGKVVFTIEIDEWANNKEYYEVKIYTNNYKEQLNEGEKKEIEKIEKLLEKAKESQKHEDCIKTQLDKYEDKADIQGLVLQRNKTFQDTILNKENNRLRDSSLGSIEMDTCAAYLRKLPVTEVENEDYNLIEDKKQITKFYKEIKGKYIPKLIYAYAQENSENKVSLGYKFYLLKPKEVLVVSEKKDIVKETLFGKESAIDSDKEGIHFITPDVLNKDTYNHQFLLFIGTVDELKKTLEDKKINLSTIPKRQIAISKYPEQKYNDAITFKKDCWKRWNETFTTKVIIKKESDELYSDDKSKEMMSVIIYNHANDLEINKLFDRSNYHDMICGHHWSKKNLVLNKTLFVKNENYLQYLESIKTNVIIIDERIQKSIVLQGKQYGNKIPFAPYFENLGIFIPSPIDENNKTDNKTIALLGEAKSSYSIDHEDDPNLNSKTLSAEKKNIINYINKYAERSHFIVIHLGILEKILDNKSDEKNPEIIEKIILELVPQVENKKKIIITSGRGKPNNLPSKYSFVPISLIQNAIETTFDKHRLVQILYNSRKSTL